MDKPKYIQKNPQVGVRFKPATHLLLERLMEERRWSKASAVAYCVEQYFKLPPDKIVRR